MAKKELCFVLTDPECTPIKKSIGVFGLKVSRFSEKLTYPSRVVGHISFGFNMQLSQLFPIITPLHEWAEKGLRLTFIPSIGDSAFSAIVSNVGKEILVLEPGDVVAELRFTKLYDNINLVQTNE